LFIKLGVKNAWRNLARSLLAIISMGFAAAFLTYVITLGRGYSQGAGQPLRQMLGGEITVYRQKVVSQLPKKASDYEFSVDVLNPFTDLGFFYPNYEAEGYLTNETIDSESWRKLPAQLAEDHNVTGVYPVYRLPAYQQIESAGVGSTIFPQISLYGKDLKQENKSDRSLSTLLDSGRWFDDSDAHKRVAVVSTYQDLPAGTEGLEVGDLVLIEIPSIIKTSTGEKLDWLNSITLEFEIIGTVGLHTRDVDFVVLGELKTEQIMGYHNDVYIPQSTWEELWEIASADYPYTPEEYILQVDNLTYLEDVVFTLREQFPQIQVNSVPELNEWMLNQFLIEPEQAFLRVPVARLSALREAKQSNSQSVIIADLRLPIITLVLFNSALLLTANILILIIERKREMAVLKSIGAKKNDLISMIVTEAVMITLLGAGSGYFLVSIPHILNQINNSMGGLQILWGVILRGLIVMLVTCGCSAIFSLIPSMQIASRSVMEVLRDE